MNSITVFDLAEAAFYLHHGLKLVSVNMSFNPDWERMQGYLLFEGAQVHQLHAQWLGTINPVVIPNDLKKLLIALGKIGEVCL